MHSLAQALTLTLTLTLNHLANKPQRMASTLFGLMYLILGSTTNYYEQPQQALELALMEGFEEAVMQILLESSENG